MNVIASALKMDWFKDPPSCVFRFWPNGLARSWRRRAGRSLKAIISV